MHDGRRAANGSWSNTWLVLLASTGSTQPRPPAAARHSLPLAGTWMRAVALLAQTPQDDDLYCDSLFSDSRSEEHTSELQSLMRISYAVFCLKKKNTKPT